MDLTNINLNDLYDLHTSLCEAHHNLHRAWGIVYRGSRVAGNEVDAITRNISTLIDQVGARIDVLYPADAKAADVAALADTTPSAPLAPKALADCRAYTAAQVMVLKGDAIEDFRGEVWTFESITRAPMPGKTARVSVSQGGDTREFYATVFDLTVR